MPSLAKLENQTKQPISETQIKKEENKKVFFECKPCKKIYRNMGSLQTHLKAKHGRQNFYRKRKQTYNIRSYSAQQLKSRCLRNSKCNLCR